MFGGVRNTSGMSPLHIRRRSRRGFTLIEVMIGIVLSGMAVATLATLIPVATKGQRASREYLQMTDVAQAKMDRLKDLGYGRLNSTEIVAASIGTLESENVYKFTLQGGVDSVTNASGTITISDYNSDIRKVVVSLAWHSGGSTQTPSSYELQGLIARL